MSMFFSLALLSLVLVASTALAGKCVPTATIKRWQQYSPCAHRTELGVLIGFGYNLNLPHAKGDLATIGIDRNDIPKGIITQVYYECDCEQSVCLTPEQSQWLFDVSVDRAQKQVSSLFKSASTMCCDIQTAFTALLFTFGTERLMDVPDVIFHANSKQWKKVGSALLGQTWCKSSDRCKPLAERILEGCREVEEPNLGCSPPTPQACDASGLYCCAVNNTCCQYGISNHAYTAYWCCPLFRGVCCSSSNSCCSRQAPICCGNTNTCCFANYPVCCFPGTSNAYCCAASSPVCLGNQVCGSLDPDIKPVRGKVSNKK